MIVLDASAAVEMLLRDAGYERIEAMLAQLGQPPSAPDLIDVEVLSSLRGLLLGRKISEEKASAALEEWLSFPIVRLPVKPLLTRAWSLRHNLTPYDAVYAALAEDLDALLLTHDQGLYSACRNRAKLV